MTTSRRFAVTLATLAVAAVVSAQPPAPAPAQLPSGPAGARTPGGSIAGLALDAARRPLPDTRVQLRNLGSGNLDQVATTDAEGGVVFRRLVPGAYVMEMTVSSGAVVATSDVITVADGQTVRATVQLAARTRSFAWWLGSTTTLALAQAASLGVLALDGGQPVSPQ